MYLKPYLLYLCMVGDSINVNLVDGFCSVLLYLFHVPSKTCLKI